MTLPKQNSGTTAIPRHEVAAICARHGVTISVAPTADDREHWEAVILDSTGEQPMAVDGRECWFTCYDAPHHAVTECLKARWEIVSGKYFSAAWDWRWEALSPDLKCGAEAGHATELAAVAALADRLRGAA